MRALLIAAVMFALPCAWETSSVSQAGAAATRSTARLDLAAEEEPEEEQEGEDQASSSAEAESAASAEAEEEDEQAGADHSRSHQRKGSHSTHSSHVAVISQLGLTAKTKTALRQGSTVASSLSFSFTLSTAAKLQVTLVEQTGARGRTRWTPIPDSVVLGARKGWDTGSLSGHNRLSPGHYRLTVKPAGGRSRSIYLTARGQ